MTPVKNGLKGKYSECYDHKGVRQYSCEGYCYDMEKENRGGNIQGLEM